MKKLVLIIVLNLFLALNSFSQEKQSDSTICYPSAIMHSPPVNNNRFHPPVYQDYKKFIDTTKVIKPYIHPSPPSFPCQTPPDKAEQGYNFKKLPNLKNGKYFVSIKAKSKSYETQKLIITN